MAEVTCKYCKQKFDKSKEQYEVVGVNRYAHAACCTEDNEEYMWDKVRMYARSQLGELYNATKVTNHIKRYRDKLYFKPQRVLQALVYWYEVQGASPEKSNGGIGIVESVWQEAEDYYYKKQHRLEQTSQYNITDFINDTNKKIVVEWEPPVRPKNYHIIDLS